MDTAHWPQEMVVKPMEEIVVVQNNNSINSNNNNNNTCSSTKQASLERRVRPQKEQAINCPRCNSTNTKFCYYNNYSLSQPRYFCKTCRRYWTEGGSLRNIPVGGGSRKNKKSSSSMSSTPTSTSSTSSSSKKLLQQLPHDHHLAPNFQNPNNTNKICEEGQDLNLGFPSQYHDFKTISELIQVPNFDNSKISGNNPNSSSSHHHHLSALELLTGISTSTANTTSRGLNSFMPIPVSDPNSIYSSGFSHMQDFKPTLNFSLDGNINGSGGGGGGGGGGGYGILQESGGGRVLFPFEDLKQVSNSSDIDHQNRGDQGGGDSTGYWNGVLGDGSW